MPLDMSFVCTPVHGPKAGLVEHCVVLRQALSLQKHPAKPLAPPAPAALADGGPDDAGTGAAAVSCSDAQRASQLASPPPACRRPALSHSTAAALMGGIKALADRKSRWPTSMTSAPPLPLRCAKPVCRGVQQKGLPHTSTRSREPSLVPLSACCGECSSSAVRCERALGAGSCHAISEGLQLRACFVAALH